MIWGTFILGNLDLRNVNVWILNLRGPQPVKYASPWSTRRLGNDISITVQDTYGYFVSQQHKHYCYYQSMEVERTWLLKLDVLGFPTNPTCSTEAGPFYFLVLTRRLCECHVAEIISWIRNCLGKCWEIYGTRTCWSAAKWSNQRILIMELSIRTALSSSFFTTCPRFSRWCQD